MLKSVVMAYHFIGPDGPIYKSNLLSWRQEFFFCPSFLLKEGSAAFCAAVSAIYECQKRLSG